MTLRDLRLRLRALLAPRRAERELDEELAFHIERETHRHLASGLDLGEARRRALAGFGSVAVAADACRDERRIGFIDTSMRDVVYAFRAFRRAPLTAATIVSTVALGLGLMAAAFNFFDAYFVRVDAVRDPRELFTIRRTFERGGGAWLPLTRQELDALRTNTDILTDAIGMLEAGTTRIDGHLMNGMLVTGNFFQVLGAAPALGRALMPPDDVDDGRRVLVLSHRGWKRLLASDPSAVGRTVRVNGLPYEVAGVMPEEFRGLSMRAPDYWAPFAVAGELARLRRAHEEFTFPSVVGRLKPGMSPGVAESALTGWAPNASFRTLPGLQEQPRYITLEPSPGTLPLSALTGQIAGMFTAVFLAFGLILLIGCANVANLLLARGVERQREIGMRMALGASRSRIVRQLLTESLLLAIAAAACGFAVSRLALAGAVSVARAGSPLLDWLLSDPPAADWRVAAFLAGGAVVATASFGLVPALQGTRLAVALRTLRGELVSAAGPGRTRHGLIAAQVAASALLLICAAILIRSAQAAALTDYGVRTSDTLVIPVTDERTRSKLVAEVEAHPSVARVAASMPRLGRQSDLITVHALPVDAGGPPGRSAASYQLVGPEYLDVLGVRTVAGRMFAPSENAIQAGVVILSEPLVRRLFPDGKAVGRAVRFTIEEALTNRDDGTRRAVDGTYTVIGVVRKPDWEFAGFFRSFADVYVPSGPGSPAEELAVQVRGDPDRVRLGLLERLTLIDPAIGEIVTLQTMFGMQEHLLRTGFRATVVLAGLALVLTVSGLFGVLSYLVARRANEIGVRIALGATTRDVTRLVLSQSLRAVAIGIVGGAVLAGGLAKGLMAVSAASAIAEVVDVYDPIAYASSLLVIVAACALAASLPALRAARIDPVTTLKQE